MPVSQRFLRILLKASDNTNVMESSSSALRPGTRVVIRFARRAGLLALFILTALLGTLGGLVFVYADDVAAISALDDYKPNTITRLIASDGQQIGEFATERR